MAYALVTGASKGIGKAIIEELAQRKIDLLLVARSDELLKQEASRLSAHYEIKTDWLAIDLSTSDASAKIWEWCKVKQYSIYILVNNAGYGLSGPFEKYGLADSLNMMHLNMITPVQLCRQFLPMLHQQPKSYILNIGSSAAYQAVPYLSLYAATKSFILAFSRGLRQEVRNSAVSVTCICPGATDTGFASRAQIGEKGLKAAEKVNMTAAEVGKIAVSAMFAKKAEVITGLLNKLAASIVWLLPKGWVERVAMKIYE
jgi:short-subunit dehydrogenase